MTRRSAFITVSNLAIAAMLSTVNMAVAQQDSVVQGLPEAQYSAVPERPIEGGRHLQPNRWDLQRLGVTSPSRREIQEMDRISRQLLEEVGREAATGPEPHSME